MNFYDPRGSAIGFVQLGLSNPAGGYVTPDSLSATNPASASIGGWTPVGVNTFSLLMASANGSPVITFNTSAALPYNGDLLYQYTADSRLGV